MTGPTGTSAAFDVDVWVDAAPPGANAGIGQDVILTRSDVTLTFDDAAASALAASATLVSGTNQPSDNAPGRTLPYPAPQRPYGALLSTFNGTDPNGVWSLFVFDSAVGDAGNLAGGWILNLTTVSTVNPVADLGVTLAIATPGTLYSGTSFPFLLTVTNTGPANATGVMVTNTLPAGLDFVSALASQGGAGAVGGVVTCNLGTINAHAGATVKITVKASATGTFTNVATVTADQIDLDLNNNTGSLTATVQGVQSFTVSEPTVQTNGAFRLTLSGQAGQTYVIQGSTNLLNWVPLATNTPSTGTFKFIDTNSPSFTQRFYRAVFVPSP